MPHLHPDYGGFKARGDADVGAIAAHPEDTDDHEPGVGYYAIPALLGGVAGATAGEGSKPARRLAFTLGAAGAATVLAYMVKPKPLPPAQNSDQEIAWEGIIQAEKDTFGNVVALSMWGPLTYWSATKAKHPLLALALAGGGVAMIAGAAQNILETRLLRARFEKAVARSMAEEAKKKAKAKQRRLVMGVGATGADQLSRTNGVLAKLEGAVKPAALSALARVDREAEAAIRRTVREAPPFIFDTVVNTAIKAAQKMGDAPTAVALEDVRATGRAENMAEVREGLGAVSKILARAPAVRDLTNKAIDVLERQGVLGRGLLSDLTSLLVSAAAGFTVTKKVLGGGKVSLVTPNASVSVNKMGDYSARLRIKNPAWAGTAVTLAFSGSAPTAKREEPSRAVESFQASATIPVRFKTRTGGKALAVSPYYKGSPLEGSHEGGAKVGFRF
jgi:hypothetical protein